MYTSELKLVKLSKKLRDGTTDLIAFINDLCDQIEAKEQHLKSLLPEPNRRERLLKEAKSLQQKFPNPAKRPILYGVPVGVKDIIRMDNYPTRAGSQLPPELFEGKEALSVTALREAGALMLGKTVTTEFAYFEPGPTVNPHNIEHTPGGSSSGSASAVAAGFCPVAFGTQTVGSIIRPAAFCGVVGFKPSYNRIPTGGMIHCSKSLDHVGMFTQDLDGMELVASLLCIDWVKEQTSKTAKSLVLGVPEGPYLSQMPKEGLNAFNSHLNKLDKLGFNLIQVPVFQDLEKIVRQHEDLLAYEVAKMHAKWFDQYAELYRPRTRELIIKGQKVADEVLFRSRNARLAKRYEIEEIMDKYNIDLWVCPSAPGVAPKGIQSTGDPMMNSPWTFTGLPAITIPIDVAENGLPIGLQIVGRFMKDEKLLLEAKEINKVF